MKVFGHTSSFAYAVIIFWQLNAIRVSVVDGFVTEKWKLSASLVTTSRKNMGAASAGAAAAASFAAAGVGVGGGSTRPLFVGTPIEDPNSSLRAAWKTLQQQIDAKSLELQHELEKSSSAFQQQLEEGSTVIQNQLEEQGASLQKELEAKRTTLAEQLSTMRQQLGDGLPFHAFTTTDGNVDLSTMTKVEDTSSSPSVDVSVPYDAAARLAYQVWKLETSTMKGNENDNYIDEAEFGQFKISYHEKVAAMVKEKHQARLKNTMGNAASTIRKEKSPSGPPSGPDPNRPEPPKRDDETEKDPEIESKVAELAKKNVRGKVWHTRIGTSKEAPPPKYSDLLRRTRPKVQEKAEPTSKKATSPVFNKGVPKPMQPDLLQRSKPQVHEISAPTRVNASNKNVPKPKQPDLLQRTRPQTPSGTDQPPRRINVVRKGNTVPLEADGVQPRRSKNDLNQRTAPKIVIKKEHPETTSHHRPKAAVTIEGAKKTKVQVPKTDDAATSAPKIPAYADVAEVSNKIDTLKPPPVEDVTDSSATNVGTTVTVADRIEPTKIDTLKGPAAAAAVVPESQKNVQRLEDNDDGGTRTPAIVDIAEPSNKVDTLKPPPIEVPVVDSVRQPAIVDIAEPSNRVDTLKPPPAEVTPNVQVPVIDSVKNPLVADVEGPSGKVDMLRPPPAEVPPNVQVPIIDTIKNPAIADVEGPSGKVDVLRPPPAEVTTNVQVPIIDSVKNPAIADDEGPSGRVDMLKAPPADMNSLEKGTAETDFDQPPNTKEQVVDKPRAESDYTITPVHASAATVADCIEPRKIDTLRGPEEQDDVAVQQASDVIKQPAYVDIAQPKTRVDTLREPPAMTSTRMNDLPITTTTARPNSVQPPPIDYRNPVPMARIQRPKSGNGGGVSSQPIMPNRMEATNVSDKDISGGDRTLKKGLLAPKQPPAAAGAASNSKQSPRLCVDSVQPKPPVDSQNSSAKNPAAAAAINPQSVRIIHNHPIQSKTSKPVMANGMEATRTRNGTPKPPTTESTGARKGADEGSKNKITDDDDDDNETTTIEATTISPSAFERNTRSFTTEADDMI